MSREQENKAIVGQWFEGFWGNPWSPKIIDELAAPDILLQYSLHAPRRGREDVRNFMVRSARRSRISTSGARRTSSRRVLTWWVVGKAVARTPDPLSVIFSSVPCRRLLAGRCGSLERPCFGLKTARLQRKSAWTME